jgi:hypothetical protein
MEEFEPGDSAEFRWFFEPWVHGYREVQSSPLFLPANLGRWSRSVVAMTREAKQGPINHRLMIG